MWYLFSYQGNFDETYHNYSLCHQHELKLLSKSNIKGQGRQPFASPNLVNVISP